MLSYELVLSHNSNIIISLSPIPKCIYIYILLFESIAKVAIILRVRNSRIRFSKSVIVKVKNFFLAG